jgi:HD-GYP domain-containing protein (c-di-GMP phosphodiesterase class II)/HAMP domain-containing protein
VLGAFSWLRSSEELERSKREELRRDSKREGMELLSRLLVADSLLRAQGERATGLGSASRSDGQLAARPFRSVAHLAPASLPGGPLSAAERAGLSAGRSVLRVLPGFEVVLSRAVADRSLDEELLVAELERSYLWTFESDGQETSLTLADAQGRLIHSSLSERDARELCAGIANSAPRNPRRALAGPIAEPWRLFLASAFVASDWWVVRGASRSATFGPLAEFRVAFFWSALLALLVVAALSSIQIRRLLGPIRALADAAGRFGEGQLDARADLAGSDELGALARAFNRMAARIERSFGAIESASDVGIALTSEREDERLIGLVLDRLLAATGSRGVAFFRAGAAGNLMRELARGEGCDDPSLAIEAAAQRQLVQRSAGATAQLAAPLVDHEQHVLGVLLVSGPRDESGAPLAAFRAADVRVVLSFASQAAVALSNRALVGEFRSLFEGLIELTVKALDAKSAYTAGHCRRVPLLAEMLAAAVCRTRSGVFASFRFTSAELYELHIASLLHDFGKIVTPVHVMDKASKLETIHDRIELVATRYAVLQREAEIAWLRGRLREAGREPAAWNESAELRDELAFLREANVGEEAMSPVSRERVERIARSRRWRDAAGKLRPVLTDDELENLMISHGTLTDRERKIIEEHADMTIELLRELPFPPQLAHVPQIAGSHHERIDGGGYPLGLRGAEITLQGRILCIADVFEALTAPDRPYRAPMTVSAAVEVLRDMAKHNHLDADLLDVFLAEGVHLAYAREQLRPEQLDDETLAALARIPGGPLPS